MNDLSLLLASKELYILLQSQKIKTLKQAIQRNNKNQHNEKIKEFMIQYKNYDKKVLQTIKNQQKWWKTYNVQNFQQNPLNYYLENSSIIQIIGHKGNGKTGVLLKLGLSYYDKNKQKIIKIYNCSGGITGRRMNRFKKCQYQYYDIFIVDQLIQSLQKLKHDANHGLILIDNLTNLLLSNQKSKYGFGQLIIALRDKGWSIYFNNYIQGRYQIDQKQITNPTGYFAHIFGSLCNCKLLVQPNQSKDNCFKITMIKSLNNKSYEYKSSMNEFGLDDIILDKNL